MEDVHLGELQDRSPRISRIGHLAGTHHAAALTDGVRVL
jgi:hypothetical protein